MHHYVYQIISMIPNEEGVCRIYSGLRSCECLPEEDTEYMGSGIAISRAIAKYGRDKFMKLIIGKFSTREEAHDCETNLLKKQFELYGSDWKKFNKFNYNLRLNENDNGGNFHSPETRDKISAAKIGKNNPMFGRTGELCPNFGKQRSEETKKKISASKIGENNPNFGKQLPEETKKKLSEAKFGKKIGVKHHLFKGLVVGANKDHKTIVFCGEKDMKSRVFDPSAISKVINEKLPHYKGFVFFRTTDHSQLRNILNTAEFVDEESKQIIQQFLQQ